jgi:DNA-binding beta-propeller fold protein YncE
LNKAILYNVYSYTKYSTVNICKIKLGNCYFMKKKLLLVTCITTCSAFADFTNVPGEPGRLISHSLPELGRLTTIEVLGQYIIAVPEIPSSPLGADFNARVVDISDPSNPVTVLNLDKTAHPVLAHGTYKRGNEVYIGGFPNDAVRLEEDGAVIHTKWSGPDAYFNTSGMYHPWAARHWWSYGKVEGLGWLDLDGVRQAEWDHLGETGVIGFPTIVGNILIYSSDQTFSGMATYDISDPTNPVLLDVLNLPDEHPTFTQREFSDGRGFDAPIEYGLGGYWSAPYGHYMVFARNGNNPGIQIVDFEDPTNLKLHCEVLFQDPTLGLPKDRSDEAGTRDVQYLNFQDEYVFAERIKVNIETCELDLVLNEVENGVETSQYQRPIGNMLLTGGASNHVLRNKGIQEGGLGIWFHQSEPDTRAPFVAYHIPTEGQKNYPTIAPISVMIPETLHATTIIPGDTLIVTEESGEEIQVDYLLSHTGMLTIDPLTELKPETTYRVSLRDISDAVGNLLEPYSFSFSTGSNTNINHTPDIQPINITSGNTIQPGQRVVGNIVATDKDGDSLEYRFRIRQGNVGEYNEWSSSPDFAQPIEKEGNYTLTVQVRDAVGAVAARTDRISVIESTEALLKSMSSGPMALNEAGDSLWVVNPDNQGMAHINVPDMELVREPRRNLKPVSIGIDQNDVRWVVYEGRDRIELVNKFGGSLHTIQFDYGSNPVAILMDRENAFAYVALEGSGKVVKIDTQTRTEVARISDVKNVHSLALSGNREHLLATRFISPRGHGEVFAINPSTMNLDKIIVLEQSLSDDTVVDGRGIPNYLAHVAIDGQSRFAYVVGKKDNIGRGLQNGNDDLDDDNTVRTFVALIDLERMAEVKSSRIDIDNSDSPSAVTFSKNENYLFVALQGNNRVAVLSRDAESGRISRTVRTNFSVGLAPQGLLLNESGDELYVKNLTDRTVTQIDLTAFNSGSINNPTTTSVRSVRERDEVLSPEELLGKQIFYNASFGFEEEGEFTGRISSEGYLSCASCHFDGGEDSRVYDFTGRGEGLRNNLSLNGRGGAGDTLLHWSGNFDEVQDFENDIRHEFMGRGLLSDTDFESTKEPLGASKAGLNENLDALATYVNSLKKSSVDKSHYREEDGTMTTSAVAGHETFVDLNCQSCHFRFLFSDRKTHDVGTLREYSGNRSGGALEELRTPFLLGLFNSAPYLHDGSAETVEEVFITVGGNVTQAEDALLSNGAQIVDADGFSYYRGGAAVSAPDGAVLTITESSETERTAFIRIRYGSSHESTNLIVEVNGKQYKQPLKRLLTAEGQDVEFSEAKFVVNITTGSNEIKIWPEMSNIANQLILDDITISTPEHEAAARVHTQVDGLTQKDKRQLIDYLMQLDSGQNVPRSAAPL